MNRSESAALLAVIQSRYPQANLGRPEAATAAWEMTLDDVPYEAAELVLRDWFKAERFAPDPSELRARILSRLAEVPEPAEAWELVLRHMRENGAVGGSPFAGPDTVRQAVKAIGGWHALRSSEQPERDRDQFMRVYPTYAKRAAAAADVGALIRDRLPIDAGDALPDGRSGLSVLPGGREKAS